MKLICPACKRRSCQVRGDRDGYDVIQCEEPTCRLIWRTPMMGHVKMHVGAPREADKYTGAFYHSTFRVDGADFAERWDHDLAVGRLRAAHLRSFTVRPDVKLIDIGAGNGAFVQAALDAGFAAYGLDTGSILVEWTVEHRPTLAGRMSIGTVPMAIKGGWDVITAHDVLEHTVDPFTVLRDLVRVLARQGLIVLEEPDPECDEALADAVAWKHSKPFEHTMLPSRATWVEMLDACGCSVVATDHPVPMKMRIVARRNRVRG